MAELTSTGAHFDEGEPQLATLELVSSEEHGDGTSLTLALQPLSSKDRPDFKDFWPERGFCSFIPECFNGIQKLFGPFVRPSIFQFDYLSVR